MERKPVYLNSALFFWLAMSVVTYLFAHFFIGLFMFHEKTIYQWDVVIYWKKWQVYLYYIPRDPLRALTSFVFQLRHDIYTDLPAVLCTPLGWVLGPSRTSFIHSITAFYTVPAVLCGVLALRNYTRTRAWSSDVLVGVLGWMHLLLFVPMWRPVVRGNVGSGAVLIAFVILTIWLCKPLKKQKLSTLFLVAGLLVLLPLFRRWMAFWVVSFFIACGVTQVFPLLWREGVGAMMRLGSKVAIVGVVSLGLFLAVVWPGLHTVWLVDYQDAYADYALARSFEGTALMAHWHVGAYFFGMALWGIIHGLLRKKTRSLTGFLTVHLVASAILFLRTQDLAEHHYYLLLPCFSLLAAQGAMDLLWRVSRGGRRWLVAALLGAFLLLQFASTFSPLAKRISRPLSPLFSSWDAFPFQRDDLNEVAQLLGVLAEQVEKEPESRIYTLASSRVMSDNLLRDAHLILDLSVDIRPNLLSIGHRDRSDFFPRDLISCDYAVVCDPPQIHLSPEDQKIVVIPTQHFLEARGLAKHFERVGRSFMLSGGVKAMIYRRTSAIGVETIALLERELGAFYSASSGEVFYE